MVSSLLFCFVPLALQQNLAFHSTTRTSNDVVPGIPMTSQSLASCNPSTDDLLPIIHEVVEANGDDDSWTESWTESKRILSKVLPDDDNAELYLATAFRWKDWAKLTDRLKQFRKPVLPDPTKVQEALTWLTEGPLELSEDQVRHSIRYYPELYLVNPQDLFRKVNGVAPRKHRENLKELIQIDPNVLQVTYNCDGGSCAGNCGSCWVTYATRLP